MAILRAPSPKWEKPKSSACFRGATIAALSLSEANFPVPKVLRSILSALLLWKAYGSIFSTDNKAVDNNHCRWWPKQVL